MSSKNLKTQCIFNFVFQGQEIQVTCFQASPSGHEKLEVPLFIESVKNFSGPCGESIFQLPQIISQEDLANYEQIQRNTQNNYLTHLQNDSGNIIYTEFCTSV